MYAELIAEWCFLAFCFLFLAAVAVWLAAIGNVVDVCFFSTLVSALRCCWLLLSRDLISY